MTDPAEITVRPLSETVAVIAGGNSRLGVVTPADIAPLGVFRAYEEEVRRTIAPEHLLAYDVSQGWEPLCAFLEVSVPDTPFPRTNTSEEFREKRPDLFEA